MLRTVYIGEVLVGLGCRTLIVAEIGLNHDGDSRLAHALLDTAVDAGANMVKFQKRCPSELACSFFLDAPFRKASSSGLTQREVRDRLELSLGSLRELKVHANDRGIVFSMSVFDLPSLQTALDLGIPVIKVASHSITNAQLLEGVAETELPVIASMGATTWAEKDRAFAILRRSPLIILHCVSAYPCPDSQAHLDTITALRRRYRCPVGYSGHEQGVDISVAASVLGACVIERHITIDRWKPTLDAAVSLEPSEFSTMVQRIRTIESARGIVSGPVSEECESRAQYHVALCANRYIVKGEILTRSDICAKQPLGSPGANFTGLELSSLVGARVKRDLQSDEPIPRNAVELCHSSP